MNSLFLGASLSVALTATAHAQTSYATGFEIGDGFAPGSIEAGASEGNANWQHAANGSSFGTVVTGTANTGNQSLAIVRAQSVNSGVIHGVRSPELLLGTGNGAGTGLSGAAYREFSSSFWIRTGPGNGVGEINPYFLSINAWSNNRMSWISMDFNRSQEGLAFYMNGVDNDGNFLGQDLITSNLTPGSWYRIDQLLTWGGDSGFVNTRIYDESLNEVGNSSTTTWDKYYENFGPPVRPVNQLNFRTSTGTEGVVAYIDDVSYSVSAFVPEPATWAMMISGFGLAGAAVRRQRPVALA
jgi:hypothetical protein